MSLQVVPARTGLAWVKQGIKTFFKQPLALGGLFFMFIALISLVSQVPLLGSAIALAILPALTVGLMAAAQETEGNHVGENVGQKGAGKKGSKFPMPLVLFTAFRAGNDKTRAILVLGALYAIGFVLVLGVSALFDGGQLASLYLSGSPLNKEAMMSPDLKMAAWAAMILYLPLSMAFWHAPALVHWHNVPPLKALFFSLVACFKNFAAMTVYFFMWLAVFSLGGLLMTLLAIATGSESAVSFVMLPAAMLMAAMFFTSIYFTYQDCFSVVKPSSDVV